MQNFFLKKKYLYILILGILSFFTYKNCEFSSAEFRIFSYVHQLKFSSIPKNEIKTFVINLDRSPARYNNLVPNLKKNHLQYERFSAVDGYKIKIKDNKTGEIFLGSDLKVKKLSSDVNYTVSCPSFEGDYLPLKQKKEHLSAGEFGCYCSHMEIWNKVSTNDVKYALVLEDDALLLPRFEDKLDEIISKLPADWDVIFLHLIINPSKTLAIKHNKNLQKIKASVSGFWCTTAYLINTKGAQKLFNFATINSCPIDISMSKAVNMNKIKAYKSVDDIVVPSGDESVIAEMGR